MKIFAAVLLLVVAGCAYPGREALLSSAVQISASSGRSLSEVQSCLVSYFDNERIGAMDIRSPISRVDSVENGIRLVSIGPSDVWLWETYLYPLRDGTRIEANVREGGGGPYVSRSYFKDKLSNAINQCRQ